MRRKILIFLISIFFVSSFSLYSYEVPLTILHTNDTHSHLFSFGPQNSYGGIARMSTLMKKLKAKNENVLALHAGDVFVGTFAFNKHLGFPELKIMEGLYDAMCLGNHEYDLGLGPLTSILSGVNTGALPLLCANIDLSLSSDPAAPFLDTIIEPYTIINVGDLKIGIVGVVETDEFDYSPDVYALLTDPFVAAGTWAAYLKMSEGCDIVICLSHLGKGYMIGWPMVPYVDIVVDGHSHDLVPAEPTTPIIVQAGEFGMHLGELQLSIDVDDISGDINFITLVDHELHPITRKVRKDPKLMATLNSLRDGIYEDPRFGPLYSQHVAKASWTLEERWEEGNPYRDTPLGNLVADAFKDGVLNSGYPVDCAIQANGYIGHKIYKGKVVGNDVLRSVPYGYDPASGLGFKVKVVMLFGLEIYGGLEFSVQYAHLTDSISLQVSGLEFEYDSTLPPGGRVNPASIKINGAPIDLGYPPTEIYYVAINEQLISVLENMVGLDLNNPFPRLIEPSLPLFEYNLVRDYMNKLNHLEYTSEGRIIDIGQ